MEQQDAELAAVFDGPEYGLSAAADGQRYVLRFKTDAMTADLVGEDAERFRADLDSIKAQYPDWSSDQILAQLWDQGGYSWLAVQDG